MYESARGVFSPLHMAWDGKRFILTEDLRYWHKGRLITVPKGFMTDLDSVPRLPIGYWLLKDRSKRPAVVHDWLYYSQAGREYADEVFLEAMKTVGVPAWQRYPIYWAVRAGGWVQYKQHGKRHG